MQQIYFRLSLCPKIRRATLSKETGSTEEQDTPFPIFLDAFDVSILNH